MRIIKLSTDATPFLARGYRALTLIALNKKGLPVNWHWKTDTIDAVEPENLVSTSNLICSLLQSNPK
ncbi:MAG: Zn-dependent exopeptidase M28 [Candidatus Atribacteria bacterium]|nr:Zn-dependent exopeptidase M28 [Candidatus Atribacteria bacterium]